MIKIDNKKIRSVLIKLILTCLIIIILNIYILKIEPLTFFLSKTFILLGSLWISLPLFISSKKLYPGALKSFKIKLWRMTINIRKYYKLTKINNFILHIGTLGIFITSTLQIVFNVQLIALTCFTIVLLSTSFILDIYHRIKFIVSKVWEGIIGKIILALYVAIAFIISNYLIRHWVIYTTELDPKNFPEFVNSFSIFFTPIAYLIITIFFCLIIIIPEVIMVIFFMLFNPLKENIIKKKLPSLVRLSVRIRTGKRPENLTHLEQALMSSKVMAFRILSAPFFLLSICYLMTQIDHLSGDFFDKAGRFWLVNYYYHTENHSIVSTMRYYTINDSKTSIAILKDGKWQFFTLDI